tara:strand:+ start:426 stop:659 length:234 start_codon:yes stop_codon:yes gene_type:complete
MVRDWGYGDKGSIDKTPEALAGYVKFDSKALSRVSDDSLLDELEVRLLEYAELPARELSERISDVMFHYDEVVEQRK